MKKILLSLCFLMICSHGFAGGEPNPSNPNGKLALFAVCSDTDDTPEEQVSFKIFKDKRGQYFAEIHQVSGDDLEEARDWIQLNLEDWGFSTIEFTQVPDFWPTHDGVKLASEPTKETKDLGISLSISPDGSSQVFANSGPMGLGFEKADLDCELHIKK